jgi:fucose 4-O-acetylase-like acetyltransferase
MIILVVLTHVAVTYSGMGSWYYKEGQSVGMTSMVLFGVYQSFAQAFSMGLLFLLAGYFIPGSLERKGAARFVKERLFRLGVPTLVFMFILHPLCVAITNPDIEIVRYYIHGIASLEFLSWSGPLWFALRTVFPLGTDVVNMQLGYFSSYIIMFVLGIRGYPSGLLDGIDYQVGRKWFLAAFALWESFFCVAMIIGLISIF